MGNSKLAKINDPFRDVCTMIADREDFLSFVKAVNAPQGVNNDRRFVVHDVAAEMLESPEFLHAMESALLARSLICGSPARVLFKLRLLRVLAEVYSDSSLEAAFEQVNSRFLAYESIHGPTDWEDRQELPSSISLLWNVQTLIFGKKAGIVVAPSQFWEMRTIRHLHFYRICLPDPPAPANDDEDEDDSILQNLQTLGTMLNLECSEEVCKRMPNVKKLRVSYEDVLGEEVERKYFYSLFTKLESLNCSFRRIPDRDDLLQSLKFPSSLKKLVLQDCELHWTDLSIIGSLPFLEVLKLKCQSVRGPRWETVEGEFVRLKYLEIDSCYLIYWSSDKSHFPVLEKLVLRRLYRLKEIPLEIGEITKVQEICVFECSVSAAMSGVRILDELEKLERFQVRVRLRNEEEEAEFKAKVKSKGLRSSNLHISPV